MHSLFLYALENRYTELYAILTSDAGQLISSAMTSGDSWGAIAAHPKLPGLLWTILLLSLLLIFMLFVIYAAFQAASWFIASKMSAKKVSYLLFLKGIVRYTIPWLILLVIIRVIEAVIGLMIILAQKGDNWSFPIWFTLPLALVACYVLIFRYTSIPKNQKLSFQPDLVGAIVLVIGAILALDTLLGIVESWYLVILLGLITLLPLFTVARVYLIRVMNLSKH